VVHNPDIAGAGCDFRPFSFYLGGKRTYYGLPNNPKYNLGPLTGSLCDTITVGINEYFDNPSGLRDLVYPNPASGQVTYTSNQVFGKNERLIIKDNTGRETGTFELPENLNFYKLAISDLQPGIYFITRVSDSKFVEEHKLIILK